VQISAETVFRLQQGDVATRRDFWNSGFEPVLAICSRVLGQGPTAVDVTTDLLNDFMFHYVENLSNPHGAWSYIKLMAIRRSVRERQRLLNGERFDELRVSPPENAGANAEPPILMTSLEKCMETLTPKAQSALRLKYRNGLSNEQIGDMLGGTKQYIGRLMQKSLTLIRECLQRKAVAQ